MWFQAFTGLRALQVILTILTMRTSRVAGLVFLATATLAQQQQQPVEITSEPSHHLVLQNEFVRVFDVTVAPKATTLVHKHNHDYLFVTLGDSDVVSERPGEKPVALQLKDGEVRYTPGNFAHAAINKSDRPFHNITIELLKPSDKVTTCSDLCITLHCGKEQKGSCPSVTHRITADQWTVSLVRLPPNAKLDSRAVGPTLLIAVSDLNLSRKPSDDTYPFHRSSGGLDWIPAGLKETMSNESSKTAQFVTLEFKPEKQNQ
jgi:quercetin dioxygenase-like cupin family protein